MAHSFQNNFERVKIRMDFQKKTAAGKSGNFSDFDLAQLKEVRRVKIFSPLICEMKVNNITPRLTAYK